MAMQEIREGKHQIVVRIPVSLHAALTELATTNQVSVNQQVCDLVEDATRTPDPAAGAKAAA